MARVVLPGLDRGLDEESWQRLDPGHPQFGLKQLLDTIGASARGCGGLARRSRPIPRARHCCAKACVPRRPPMPGARWPNAAADDIAQGLEGLSLGRAADPAEEALVIALALREALETRRPHRRAGDARPQSGAARGRANWRAGTSRSTIPPAVRWPIPPPARFSACWRKRRRRASRRCRCWRCSSIRSPAWARTRRTSAPGRASSTGWCLRGPRPDPGLDGIARRIAKRGAEARSKDDRESAARGWRRGGARSPRFWRRWNRLSRRPN